MSTPYEIEQEIAEQLTELRTAVSRQKEQDIDPNTIQRSMDKFMIVWSERLVEAEQQELELSEQRIEQAHPAPHEVTIQSERERSASVRDESAEMEALIKERFSVFRDAIFTSIRDIEQGREPSFAELLEQHLVWRSVQNRDKMKP